MARKIYYFPRKDDSLVRWLNNFTAKLAPIATDLGVKPAELTEVLSLATDYKDLLNTLVQIETDKQEAVGRKNESKQSLADYYRPLIQRIKNHPNYSEAIQGKDLGIVGAEETIDLINLIPKIKIVLDSGRPKIVWKKTIADAIKIFVDRRDGNGFQFLALDTKPDYIDTCEMPAGKDSVVWKYKAVYIINDAEAGKYSEVASVTVTKQV